MKKKPWKRLSQSDSEAVMRLVDEYQSSIKRIIVSVLKGQWPDAVDDILQDTFSYAYPLQHLVGRIILLHGKMNCLEQCRTYQGLWNLRNRMCLAIVH